MKKKCRRILEVKPWQVQRGDLSGKPYKKKNLSRWEHGKSGRFLSWKGDPARPGENNYGEAHGGFSTHKRTVTLNFGGIEKGLVDQKTPHRREREKEKKLVVLQTCDLSCPGLGPIWGCRDTGKKGHFDKVNVKESTRERVRGGSRRGGHKPLTRWHANPEGGKSREKCPASLWVSDVTNQIWYRRLRTEIQMKMFTDDQGEKGIL